MIDRIKAELLQARKDRNEVKKNVLNTLMSEAKTKAINNGKREPDEALVMKTLQKFLKSIEETISLKEKQGLDCTDDKTEREVLLSFMPEPLTEEELSDIIDTYIEELDEKTKKNMGKVMGRLKSEYDGRFDGKKAASITASKLN